MSYLIVIFGYHFTGFLDSQLVYYQYISVMVTYIVNVTILAKIQPNSPQDFSISKKMKTCNTVMQMRL